MGKFITYEGIDVLGSISTANTLTGSLAVTGSLTVVGNMIANNFTVTGNISGSDIIAEDDLFAKGINSTTSQTVSLVAVDTSTGQLYYAAAPSQIARPSNGTFFISGSGNITYNASSSPTIFELNGGTLLGYINTSVTGRLIIGLADVVTDYNISMVNYSGTSTAIPIQVTTPNSPGGLVWDVYFTGYVSSTNEIWWEQFLNQNSGTGVQPSRKVDQSGRMELTMDFSTNVITVWCSNWE
jgi:hypothetical protein